LIVGLPMTNTFRKWLTIHRNKRRTADLCLWLLPQPRKPLFIGTLRYGKSQVFQGTLRYGKSQVFQGSILWCIILLLSVYVKDTVMSLVNN